MPVLGGLFLIASSVLVTRRRWCRMKGRSVNGGLLLLAVLLMASCTLAHLPGEAWLGLVHFLPYFWLMAAQAELMASPKQLQQTAILIALTVLPLVLIGLGELFLGWSSPGELADILPWPPTAGGTPPGRMASVFGYANNLALYLNMALAMLLGLVGYDGWGHDCEQNRSHARASVAPGACSAGQPMLDVTAQPVGTAILADALATPFSDAVPTALATITVSPVMESWLSHWPRSRRLFLWTLLIILCLVGLVLTQSRSAWGLGMLSGLAMAIYWGWTWLGAVLLGFAGSIFWAAFGPFGKASLRRVIPDFFWARLTDQNFSDRPIETLRITQWKFVLDLSESRPLSGWGLRNFSHLYQNEMGIWMGHPHNLFLMLGAETGWFITGGLLGLVGWIFYRGIEVIRTKNHLNTADCYLFFGILIAFLNTIFFHLFDIPLFDFRINALGWMIVSQILGVVYLSDAGNLNLGRTEQFKAD